MGRLILMLICIAAPFLLLVKKRWVLIVLQTLAYLGALVWIRTCILIVRERWVHGMPYRGVIIILGSVTIFTIVSGLLLNSKKLTERYL
jgi:hypothetical protein